MNNCGKYEDQFVEALYGELKTKGKDDFDAHLNQCAKCKALFEKMQKTLQMMDERQRPELPPEYWERYDESLQVRLEKAKTVDQKKVIGWRPLYGIPGWALKAAAALILVGVGILIGRYYSTPPAPGPIADTGTRPDAPIQRAALDPETKRFLDRSEVLLVGIVNMETEGEGAYPTDLTVQKKVSQELIQEASVIKANLKGPDRRRLNQLVSDLELILLQIANLEEESDFPEIDLVRSGVDRNGVLFKINVEQMRMSGSAGSKPEHSDASGDKKL